MGLGETNHGPPGAVGGAAEDWWAVQFSLGRGHFDGKAGPRE